MARLSKQARIERILGGLGVQEGKAKNIPWHASEILIAHQFGKANGLPGARSGRLKDVERGTEIRQLAKHAATLGRHLQGMHKNSIARVDRHMGAGLHPHVFMFEIGPLLIACDRALSSNPAATPGPRGRPENDLARFVACRAAEAFRDLMGKPPGITKNYIDSTKSGKFLDLVTAIFSELKIEGSPIEWAEVACRSLRKM